VSVNTVFITATSFSSAPRFQRRISPTSSGQLAVRDGVLSDGAGAVNGTMALQLMSHPVIIPAVPVLAAAIEHCLAAARGA
jgi:hypothetical protein